MSFVFEHQKRGIYYKNQYIQTYSFGKGENYVFSFPSFPNSGISFIFFLENYNLENTTFITLDIPGWLGYSSNIFDKSRFSIQECVEIAELVAKEYKAKKLNLIGYSYGGAMAVKFAAQNPDIVDKIVLVSTIINSKIIRNFRTPRLIMLAKILNRPDIVYRIIIRRFAQLKRILIKELKISPNIVQMYVDMEKGLDAKVILDSATTLFTSDLTNELKSLRDKKFMIINSKEESPMFRVQARYIRTVLDNEKSVYLHGSHDQFLLNPNPEVVKKILKFLGE